MPELWEPDQILHFQRIYCKLRSQKILTLYCENEEPNFFSFSKKKGEAQFPYKIAEANQLIIINSHARSNRSTEAAIECDS